MKRWINKRPGRLQKVALGAVPFVLLIALYQWGSDVRKADNPADKLLPSLSEMGAAVDRLALTASNEPVARVSLSLGLRAGGGLIAYSAALSDIRVKK